MPAFIKICQVVRVEFDEKFTDNDIQVARQVMVILFSVHLGISDHDNPQFLTKAEHFCPYIFQTTTIGECIRIISSVYHYTFYQLQKLWQDLGVWIHMFYTGAFKVSYSSYYNSGEQVGMNCFCLEDRSTLWQYGLKCVTCTNFFPYPNTILLISSCFLSSCLLMFPVESWYKFTKWHDG